ncbi:MAG: hypothetical protein QOH10_2462, partial [Actinomycetota bacterium]|nr:hypothetical protein [Actinomycetota bacterium]
VDFELCEAFRAPIEHDEPICASCGHLADDHDQMASHAAVTRLPRRAGLSVRRPAPARKAS